MSTAEHYRPTLSHFRMIRGLLMIIVLPLLTGCQWMDEAGWLPDGWSISDEKVEQDPAEHAKQKTIARLIEKGDLAFTKDRLSTPANDNAVLYYREILKLSPGNEDAVRGLTCVSKRYRKLARTAHDNGNSAQARKYMALAESVSGTNDPANQKLRRKLQQTPAGQDQRALDQSMQQEYKARKQQREESPSPQGIH